MKLKTDSEFLQFALSHYDNPKINSLSEFESDIKRFSSLNSLLTRYRADALDLKDKLIVNHIIILGNCFTVPGMVVMLEYKISPNNRCTLDTFLYFLNIINKTENKLDFYLLDLLNEQ